MNLLPYFRKGNSVAKSPLSCFDVCDIFGIYSIKGKIKERIKAD